MFRCYANKDKKKITDNEVMNVIEYSFTIQYS